MGVGGGYFKFTIKGAPIYTWTTLAHSLRWSHLHQHLSLRWGIEAGHLAVRRDTFH